MTKSRSNAVANAAKGDLTVGNGTNLSGILAVGNNGETIVADSSTSTGLRYQGNYAAGKNKIINGDFGVWQRGTSFTLVGVETYTADRFLISSGSGGTCVVTRQNFTAGQTDVPNANYFAQIAYSVSGTTPAIIQQRIEDVNTFAGQTVTFTFYAKINSGTQSLTPRIVQDFGSGGSSLVVTSLTAQTLTTSWQRFSVTTTIPSISGKTIGTSSYLRIDLFSGTSSGTLTYSFANWQLEAGSVATAFQTATGTLQGELAACQRYYWRQSAKSSNYSSVGNGNATSTTVVRMQIKNPVSMRTEPSSIDANGLYAYDGVSLIGGLNSIALDFANESYLNFSAGTPAGSFTANRPYQLVLTYPTAWIGCSAEL